MTILLTKKIFIGIITICAVSVIAAIVLVTAFMYDKSVDTAEKEVKNQAHIISSAVERLGDSFLESTDFGDDIRVTWIDQRGQVVFDTEEAPEALENHSDRKEISEAFEKGEGSSSRYSKTIMQKSFRCTYFP